MANGKPSTAWRVAEAVAGVLGVVAILGFVAMRDDVIATKSWVGLDVVWHSETDERLDHLERPELLIQLAQAHDAVDQVEETAKIARENQSAIALVQAEQYHQRSSIAQLDGYLRQLLDHADVTPRPVRPPPLPPTPPN